MTEIILTRHGETKWNATEVFRGRANIELSETGIKQAELLAEYLSHLKIEAVCASPVQRALQTAEIVASYHKLDVKVNPGLTDLDFGDWQGVSRQEVKEKYSRPYAEWLERPHQMKIPGGEGINEVRDRAISVVTDVISKYKGTVVLVSHRVVNKVLICALLGLDNSHFWNIHQDTCGITTFAYKDKQFILMEHNNTSFLKSINQAQHGDF